MPEFDPFEFVPLLGPAQKRRGGREYTFQRGGKDLGEFSALLAFGKVKASGDQVVLTLHRQQKALEGKVARNAKRLDGAERRVSDLRGDVQRLSAKLRASRLQRKQGLTNQRAGANRTMRPAILPGARNLLRNPIGRSFIAAQGLDLAGQLLNGFLDAAEDVKQRKKEGQTGNEIARSYGGQAAKAVLSPALPLAGFALRAAGNTQGNADRIIEDFFKTKEEIRRREEARQIQIEARTREVQQQFSKVWEDISNYKPGTFILKGKKEAEMYRRDMQRINFQRHEHNRRAATAAAKIEAMSASMGGM